MKIILDIVTGNDDHQKLPVDVPSIYFVGVNWVGWRNGHFSDDHLPVATIIDSDLSVERAGDGLMVMGARGKEIFRP